MSRAPRNASRGSSTDNPLVRSLPICGHFARISFFFLRFLETDKNLLPQPFGRNDLILKPGREGRRERKLIPTFQPSTLRTYPYRNTASVPNLISLRSFPPSPSPVPSPSPPLRGRIVSLRRESSLSSRLEFEISNLEMGRARGWGRRGDEPRGRTEPVD